ncbi:type IV fimbrial biogenesis protein FimT [Andreprevotia lacus DSM 23236]|jgi:type IV fimbrial biogenesis protein FimT|uniref:Type II secretion system protein H n=1 Tax=Andreprevotia lacus DSM 23236 TaxID=1121001 RepID=A0A1W1XFK0_9NEIS|nr:prepilin-type N-terminal cleavage/methylation domain-containing protein [Andreprevotia lacus]SMC22710.1 type IV fimbrial biogenesis protein FimT [Andreprevotia lacus DSM 23236]
MRKWHDQGFTLVELAIVLTLLGILLAIALPSYANFIDRQRLRAAAETVTGDFNWAKSLSRNRSSTIYTSFSSSGSTWCYGFSANASCDCTTSGSCELKTVLSSGTDFKSVTASSSTINGSKLDAVRGLVTTGAASMQLASSRGYTLQMNLSAIGTVSMCSPGRDDMGYKAC